MPFVSVFLTSLLCTVYNCDYEHPGPTIKASATLRNGFEDSNLVVETKSGAIQGFLMTVASGRPIAAFEGVPFAEPPINELRFRDPVPKFPWEKVRSAIAPGPDCLQMLKLRSREDCLYLNLYTAQLLARNGTNNVPVIVWFHGGSFMSGAGREYGPSYLLKHDVILVTVNYRLGVLGFMSTGDEASWGNYGLKDQAMAIKWVHDNIEVFGGDRKRISIMGQSAGAGSVHLHMMSQTSVAKGLFSTAASLSGTAFSPWCLQSPEYARKLTSKLAKIMSCPTDSGSKKMVDCLRSSNPSFLVANQIRLFTVVAFPVVLFGPVIERNNILDGYITDAPEKYYARNEVATIPWMATTTEHEAEFAFQALRNTALILPYLINWRTYLPILLDLIGKTDDPDDALKRLVKNYIGEEQNATAAHLRIWAQMASDRYYQYPLRETFRHHVGLAPLYSYIFGFSSRIGVTAALFNDYRDWGSSHAEDLTAIFNSSTYFPGIVDNEPIDHISNVMTSFISNFATKGVPFYTNTSGQDVSLWKAIQSADNPQFLHINRTGEVKMISDPFKERIKTWKSLNVRAIA